MQIDVAELKVAEDKVDKVFALDVLSKDVSVDAEKDGRADAAEEVFTANDLGKDFTAVACDEHVEAAASDADDKDFTADAGDNEVEADAVVKHVDPRDSPIDELDVVSVVVVANVVVVVVVVMMDDTIVIGAPP